MTTASKYFQTVYKSNNGHYEETPSNFKFIFDVCDVFSTLPKLFGLGNATDAKVSDSVGLLFLIGVPELIIYDDELTFIS